MMIDVQGLPCQFRLRIAANSHETLAELVDRAIKSCQALWVPATQHALSPGGVADKADFEGEVFLDAGSLTSALIRAGSNDGLEVTLAGAGEHGAPAGDPRLVLSQQQLRPRSVEVRLVDGGLEIFKGRHDDFLGWARQHRGT